MTIRFGTDGWRALLDKDFTDENVAIVAKGFANVYRGLPEADRPVIIGYDRRRRSKESAEVFASVLLAAKIPVILSKSYCPTPCVSWSVVHEKAAAGVMITASHNPPQWNGIKFKESYGGAASSEFLKPIEEKIDELEKNQQEILKAPIENHKLLKYFDPHQEYLAALRKLVDIEKIKKQKFKILYDPLYGAGVSFLESLLGDRVEAIHTKADTNFGGIHPEPIQPYVNEAIDKMKNGDYSVCLINDGDADRIGAVDEKGNFVTSHEIFALLLKHLVEAKKMKGKVLKSISTTVMIDRLCARYDLPCVVTKIGFRYISPQMHKEKAFMGGEESGGIAMAHHICERDGLYCALLLLEMMTARKKLLGELVADLQREVGPVFYKRKDFALAPEQRQTIKTKLDHLNPKELAGKKLKKKNLIDGYHFTLEDDSWLLIRPSGTEPLLRTYAEAPTTAQVDLLLEEARSFI